VDQQVSIGVVLIDGENSGIALSATIQMDPFAKVRRPDKVGPRGMLLNGDPDWAAAEREFLRSIELNPSYAEGHQVYGIYLSLRGRFDEATAEADRAVMLDPVGRSPKSQAAWIDVCAGNYDKAISLT
jgi:lipoprotein NlpI